MHVNHASNATNNNLDVADVKVFAEKVGGFAPDLLDNAGNTRTGKGP